MINRAAIIQDIYSYDDFSFTVVEGQKNDSLESTLTPLKQLRQEKKEEAIDPTVTWSGEPKKTDDDPIETSTKGIIIPIEPISVQCLISMLASEDCETGISNPSEAFFMDLLKANSINALNVLSTVFINCFSLEPKKISILVGTLHLISHLDYEQVYPTGQALAIAAIGHKNAEVAEYGIKCFENWKHPDGITKLKAIKFSTKWLQEYADDVIEEISEDE